jgi:hypothetical protein
MTTHDNRDTSKTSPAWVKPAIAADASVAAGQAICCGTHIVRRVPAVCQRGNQCHVISVMILPGNGTGQVYPRRSRSRWNFPETRDLAPRHLRRYGQPDPLYSNDVTGFPKGSSGLDMGSSGRYRGRGWRRVLPQQAAWIR